MRPSLIVSEARTGLRRNMTMTTAAVLVTAIALAMFGAALLVTLQMSHLKDFWYGKIEVSIYLCGDNSDTTACPDGAVTAAERSQIQGELNALPEVDQVFYESQQQAYERFKEQAGNSALLQYVTADALPESFRVKLVNPEQDYTIVASKFDGAPGVERVVDQRAILDRLFAALNVFRAIAWLTGAVALIAMVLLIAVVIRVAAFSRRRETSIMRLVGASNFSIQAPFLLEGVFVGVVGALLASGFLWALYLLFFNALKVKIPLFAALFLGSSSLWLATLALLAIGVVVTGIVSFIGLQRYLKV
jgi:cell division transport system permease protein